MLLTDNDWHLFNQIVYDIYSQKDAFCMRKKFIENIKMLVPYDKANFFLADISDSEHLITNPISVGFEDDEYEKYYEALEKHDHNNWIFITAQNNVFLLSELLSPNELRNNLYTKSWLIPKKIEHVLLLSLSFNNVFVGVASLFRTIDSEPFSARDKKIFDLLKNHLSLFLYKELFQNKIHMSNTSKQVSEKYCLSQRETDIFTMLVSGEDSPQICRELSISESTFRKHCSNIYHKLGVSKKSELYKFFE